MAVYQERAKNSGFPRNRKMVRFQSTKRFKMAKLPFLIKISVTETIFQFIFHDHFLLLNKI